MTTKLLVIAIALVSTTTLASAGDGLRFGKSGASRTTAPAQMQVQSGQASGATVGKLGAPAGGPQKGPRAAGDKIILQCGPGQDLDKCWESIQ
ncbi:MAG TPA: hypothetical protein VHG92_08500 [Afifellaceae bacterium]|nr:hypothetical protein [Afifellaceae bacterium]